MLVEFYNIFLERAGDVDGEHSERAREYHQGEEPRKSDAVRRFCDRQVRYCDGQRLAGASQYRGVRVC